MAEIAPDATYAELAVRAAGGDRRASALLCERFVPAVRAFARRRLRTTEAVEELTQDVMLLFVEALDRGAVEDPERLPGFVLGICKNVARDRARKRERRDDLFQKYSVELSSIAEPNQEKPTYEVLHLEDCLTSLSRRARDVIRLSFVEAQSHADIAQALSLSEGNVRVLRHRSLSTLRECMSRRISWEAA